MTKPQVRLARKSDKEAVLAFCKHTWENHEDHIHMYWDKWLTNPKSSIFVVTVNEIPVAIERVVRMSEKEAWVEGLRVDPNYRRQGLSRILESHINQYLSENNISVCRSCIYSDNEIMKGVMSRRGHKKIDSYAFYETKPIPMPISQLIKLTIEDLEDIWSFINKPNFSEKQPNIYPSCVFKCQKLTSEKLRECLFLGKVFGLKQNEQLLSMAIEIPLESYSEISNTELFIGYINSAQENLSTLLLELQKLAYYLKRSAIFAFFPINEILDLSLSRAGYQEFERECYVYEWQNK